MAMNRFNISLFICLVSLFSVRGFSQQMNTGGRYPLDDSLKVIPKPRLNFTAGSNIVVIPHYGSVSEVTLSSSFSVPLSPKLSFDGGIIASYLYSSPRMYGNESFGYGSFTVLSVYGAARYQMSPQLTLYGTAIKQLAGNSPVYFLPQTSYSIGSSYDFGNVSVGVTFRMSRWERVFSISGQAAYLSS